MSARRRLGRLRALVWAGTLALAALVPFASARAEERELERIVGRMLAAPEIRPAAGLEARLLVPPGELYDPLYPHAHAGAIWINDDGGEEGEWGGRIVALGAGGLVAPVVAFGRLLPVTGFDVAPPGFGTFGGSIFALTQPRVGEKGASQDHLIQRVDPAGGAAAETFCALATGGKADAAPSGYGIDARFGPPGSAFAGRFFAVTGLNGTVYQATPDGRCTPFAVFDARRDGMPAGLAFSPDGGILWVALGNDAGGRIARIRPDGSLAEPLLLGKQAPHPMGLAFAPAGFAVGEGELFLTEFGEFGLPVPGTQPLPADGRVLRVDARGEVHLVASGFKNPAGLLFDGDRLVVADLNGDFIAGHRELPDGFVVELRGAGLRARAR
jgi:hypothetical protein